MLGGQLLAGPESGGGGHGVEVIEFEKAGRGFVVIAANENFSQGARPLDHFVRGGPVAHDIAKICDEIERRSCGEAGLQRFKVGVNVAK